MRTPLDKVSIKLGQAHTSWTPYINFCSMSFAAISSYYSMSYISASFVLILSCLLQTHLMSAETGIGVSHLTFEVKGTVDWQPASGYELTNYVGIPQYSTFWLGCNINLQYLIIIPSNWPSRIRFDKPVPGLISYRYENYLTQSFTMEYSKTADKTNKYVSTWEGGIPLGRLKLRQAYTLWHAYLSFPFTSGGDPRVIDQVNKTSMSAYDNDIAANYLTNRQPPHLPVRIEWMAKEGKIMEKYETLSWTNVNGIALPLSGRHTYFSLDAKSGEQEMFFVTFSVSEVKSSSIYNGEVYSMDSNMFSMTDYTYQYADPPFTRFQYSNTLLNIQDTHKAYTEYKMLQLQRRSRNSVKGRHILYVFAAILLLPPLIYYYSARRRCNIKQTQQPLKHNEEK